jgi:hypothetical protein
MEHLKFNKPNPIEVQKPKPLGLITLLRKIYRSGGWDGSIYRKEKSCPL